MAEVGNETIYMSVRGDLRTGPDGVAPALRFAQLIEECRVAEELGYRGFWMSEQHGVADDHCGPQLTLLAGLASVTSKIRLMPCALLLPLYPLRDVVEQAGLVDLLSGGRLDLTVAGGEYAREFIAFGKDIKKRPSMMEELLPRLREGLHEGRIPDGPQGSYLPVSPRPLQRRMPIYGGSRATKAIDRIVRHGLDGLVIYDHEWPEEVLPNLWTQRILPSLTKHGRNLENFRITLVLPMWATDDPERDWDSMYRPSLEYMERRYVEMTNEGAEGVRPPDGVALSVANLRSRLFFDTPEQLVARLLRLRELIPFAEIGFWYRMPGIPHDHALRHLELISNRVAPFLKFPRS
jgi:alkanesulfonate monooxygenase SsuD/methylene tetrahydromethanopterin reductase-like flavin-dependent oxidoreductase (luciferase family)